MLRRIPDAKMCMIDMVQCKMYNALMIQCRGCKYRIPYDRTMQETKTDPPSNTSSFQIELLTIVVIMVNVMLQDEKKMKQRREN